MQRTQLRFFSSILFWATLNLFLHSFLMHHFFLNQMYSEVQFTLVLWDSGYEHEIRTITLIDIFRYQEVTSAIRSALSHD